MILIAIFIADSAYGDVSGLPDPYMNQQHQEMQPQPPYQQQQQHFDQPETQDGGDADDFSPNGRSRRIIREIIV